jgi:excisionase family DNA binding protein
MVAPITPPDGGKRLTVKEAAAHARVSPSMVYALLKARKIPALRVGCRGRGKWLIRLEDLEEFLVGCRVSDLPGDDGGYTYLK